MKVRLKSGLRTGNLKMLFRIGVKGQEKNVNSYASAPAPPSASTALQTSFHVTQPRASLAQFLAAIHLRKPSYPHDDSFNRAGHFFPTY